MAIVKENIKPADVFEPNLNINAETEVNNSRDEVEEEERSKISDNKMVESSMEEVYSRLELSKYFTKANEDDSEKEWYPDAWNNYVSDLMAGGMTVADENGNILTDPEDVSKRMNEKHDFRDIEQFPEQSVMGSIMGSEISENNKEIFALSMLMISTKKSAAAMKDFNEPEALERFMKTKAFNRTFDKLKGREFSANTPAMQTLQEEITRENSEIALADSKKALRKMENEIGSHAVNENTIREVSAYLTLKDAIESSEADMTNGSQTVMKETRKSLMTTMSQATGDHPESLKQYRDYLNDPKLKDSINKFKDIKTPVPVGALTGTFIGEKNRQLQMRNKAYDNANANRSSNPNRSSITK